MIKHINHLSSLQVQLEILRSTHTRSMASDQYNLRSGKRPTRPVNPEKPNIKRRRVHGPTKPDPPDTQTPSELGRTATAPSSPESLPAGTRMIFQQPHKWTLDHLRVTNLQQEKDVPLERIIPAKHIPSPDDPGKSVSVLYSSSLLTLVNI